jgi:type II secretory pathway component HofQ
MRALALGLVLVACHSAPRPDDGKPRIDLDLHDAPVYEALRAIATRAHVNLDADPGFTGTVTMRVQSTRWDEALAMIAKEHHLRVVTAGPVMHVSDASKPVAEPTFAGTPIEVRFDDTPLREAVSTIAEVAKLPITVDDGVDASVTLHLRKVPWDLALDHLVRKYELRMVRTADGIRIAKP